MDKGQKEYEAHVASQRYPKRYKPWDRLTETQQAEFIPTAKPKKAKAKAKKK